MKNPTPELSALFDGELEGHVAAPILDRMTTDETMRNDWRLYALIRDRLRGETGMGADMTAAVMAQLRDKPVVLAPRNLAREERIHPMMALAASVAGVAMVGLLAFSGHSTLMPVPQKMANVTATVVASRPLLVRPAGKRPPGVVVLPVRDR
jgi:negative regulator of sigma E activity